MNEALKREKKTSYDDVELGVDVDEPALVVDDGQGRDAPFDELFQGEDDGRVVVGRLHVVVRADAQLAQRLVHVRRLWHVVDLWMSSKTINRLGSRVRQTRQRRWPAPLETPTPSTGRKQPSAGCCSTLLVSHILMRK